ncbi:MAG: lipopolysaccharide biosynthesis protein [Methanomassiliicoccales archaeon]
MSEAVGLVRKVGLVGLTNILGRASGIILLPVLTKTLPIEEYGLWVILTATFAIGPRLIPLGLPYAFVRFSAAEKDSGRIREGFYSVAGVVTLSSGLFALAIAVLAPPLSEAFGIDAMILHLLAIIIFLECLIELFTSFFRTFMRIKTFSALITLKMIFQIGLISLLVLSGYGIEGALLGFLLSDLLVAAAGALLVLMRIGVAVPSFGRIGEYLRFGLPTIPSNLSNWVLNSSDRYIIGILLGSAFVGYYSPGYSLGGLLIILVASIRFILPPTLSKYYDEERMEWVRIVLEKSVRYFLLLSIPAVVGLSMLSEEILLVLSTEEIARNGYYITPFAAVSMIIFGLYSIVSNVLIMEKRTKVIGMAWSIAAIFNLLLNIALIPLIGITGAAITTLLSYILTFLMIHRASSKRFKITLERSSLTRPLIAAGVMAIPLLLWRVESALLLGVEIAICAALYFTVLYAIGGINREDVQLIKGTLRP